MESIEDRMRSTRIDWNRTKSTGIQSNKMEWNSSLVSLKAAILVVTLQHSEHNALVSSNSVLNSILNSVLNSVLNSNTPKTPRKLAVYGLSNSPARRFSKFTLEIGGQLKRNYPKLFAIVISRRPFARTVLAQTERTASS